MHESLAKSLLLLFILLFMVGFFYKQYKQNSFKFYGTVIDTAKPIKAFSLEGIDKKKFTNESLKGEWTFIFFGFTHCASVCPKTFAKLAKMYKILQEKNSLTLPKVVLISIDPEHDSLENLAKYVSKFNKNFYAARGDIAEVESLGKNFGIWFNSNSNIQHSGTIILINPNGKEKAIFTPPHRASLIAKDFIELSKR